MIHETSACELWFISFSLGFSWVFGRSQALGVVWSISGGSECLDDVVTSGRPCNSKIRWKHLAWTGNSRLKDTAETTAVMRMRVSSLPVVKGLISDLSVPASSTFHPRLSNGYHVFPPASTVPTLRHIFPSRRPSESYRQSLTALSEIP